MKKRKLWIPPDIDNNIYFRNMYNILKYLESLPIKKNTLKQNYHIGYTGHNDYNNKYKLTKKNIIN